MMDEQSGLDPGASATEAFSVRTLRRDDLAAVVAIDMAAIGRQRHEYFSTMIERALEHGDVQMSLVAEADGRVVGFVAATVFFGEFGIAEPTATIDAVGVDAQHRRRGVGSALLRQLNRNLGALGVSRLRTEVSWNNFELLAFLGRHRFEPAPRLCLERALDPTQPDD